MFLGNTSISSFGIIESVLEVMLKNVRGLCMSKAEEHKKIWFWEREGIRALRSITILL